MNSDERRKAALLWWKYLTFEHRFYKVIEWLKYSGLNVTEKHPNNLTDAEIEAIWTNEKF